MAAKRKKSKTKLQDNTDQPLDTGAKSTASADGRETAAIATSLRPDDSASRQSPAFNRSSWSWRPKASATAQIARESISVEQGATSESSNTTRPPSSVSKSMRGSRKSIPLVAEATKVHAVSDGSRSRISSEATPQTSEAPAGEGKQLVKEEAQLPPDPTSKVDDGKTTAGSSRGSWFGWWSRPDGYSSDSDAHEAKKMKLDSAIEEVASTTPLPGTPTEQDVGIGIEDARTFEGLEGIVTTHTNVEAEKPSSSRSWFGLWTAAQNEKVAGVQNAEEAKDEVEPDVAVSAEPSRVENALATTETASATNKRDSQLQTKGSGWAFWSSGTSQDPASSLDGSQKQIGELAVADTPSQNNPEAAQFNEERKQLKAKPKPANTVRSKSGKAKKTKDSSESSTATPSSLEQSPMPSPKPTPTDVRQPSAETEPTRRGKAAQKRPNLILPSFRETFATAPNPGYMERLTNYLAQSLHIPGSQSTLPPQHIFITPSPPKVKKAVAIGVHGFFPGALIQRVLGQPTGTSIRFANHAASAIETWCQQHQPDVKSVEIEKVALEGEGHVADRVTTLWKLLLNWLSHLQSADFIMVACHSQGVPVAIMLVAKLIQLGCLSANVRVGVCAMAGINLGPFLEYKSRFFGGSALELFEFCDSQSAVSRAYAESLDICLRSGVRISFIGSIDDQLVSLESSLHAPLSHPYVSRAVFIDGRLHAPNFLTHLVVFALKLRNLGGSDHGLLRELSGPLAGSLVGGEGHSRIYDDADVFTLAVEFALESTDVEPLTTTHRPGEEKRASSAKHMPAAAALSGSIRRDPLMSSAAPINGISPTIMPFDAPPSSANANPFNLPWAVRGMLEEPIIRQDLKWREEIDVLVKEFEEWKPVSKVLRDVKWRLEGVRNMN